MTLQALTKSPLFLPHPCGDTAHSFSDIAMNTVSSSAGRECEIVFEAPQDGDITGFGFRVDSITSTTVDVRLETVDTSTGLATGTLVDTNTNNTLAISSTGWKEVTFTAAATVSKGDLLAIVITDTTSGS